MNVLIIEDEAPAFRRLEKVLEEVEPSIRIIEVLDSVEESVKWLRNHPHPDLIFMDIQLSDGISFEIFDQVMVSKPVIFTTAFDEYMLKAFKVNSVDYLLKPIRKEDVVASLEKYHSLKTVYSGTFPDFGELFKQISVNDQRYKTRLLVRSADQLISVPVENIAYFYTRHGVVHLVTRRGKTFLTDQTLEDLGGQLDSKLFFRVNRQFLVAFEAIGALHKYHKGKLLLEVVPAWEERIVVSAEKSPEFRSWLGD